MRFLRSARADEAATLQGSASYSRGCVNEAGTSAGAGLRERASLSAGMGQLVLGGTQTVAAWAAVQRDMRWLLSVQGSGSSPSMHSKEINWTSCTLSPFSFMTGWGGRQAAAALIARRARQQRLSLSQSRSEQHMHQRPATTCGAVQWVSVQLSFFLLLHIYNYVIINMPSFLSLIYVHTYAYTHCTFMYIYLSVEIYSEKNKLYTTLINIAACLSK